MENIKFNTWYESNDNVEGIDHFYNYFWNISSNRFGLLSVEVEYPSNVQYGEGTREDFKEVLSTHEFKPISVADISKREIVKEFFEDN